MDRAEALMQIECETSILCNIPQVIQSLLDNYNLEDANFTDADANKLVHERKTICDTLNMVQYVIVKAEKSVKHIVSVELDEYLKMKKNSR